MRLFSLALATASIQLITALPTELVSRTLPAFASTKIVDSNIKSIAQWGVKNLIDHYYDPQYFLFKNLGNWRDANAYSAIIAYDINTGEKRYEATAGKYFSSYIKKKLDGGNDLIVNEYNDDSMWWANACLDAYQVYGGETYLTQAKNIWQNVISTSQVKPGGKLGIMRSPGLNASCADNQAGGVYWTTLKNAHLINSITTGLALELSARLYLITRDEKYYTAAEGAAEWIKKNTLDEASGLVLNDGITVTNCGRSKATGMTYNSGPYIAGLMFLSQAKGEKSHMLAAEKAVKGAMETKVWTDGEGHITEGKNAKNDDSNFSLGFRAILIRDMMRVYQVTTNADLKQEMKGFINTNFNLIYTKARSDSNYDVNWFGPFTQPSVNGQFTAVDLLNAAVLVNK